MALRKKRSPILLPLILREHKCPNFMAIHSVVIETFLLKTTNVNLTVRESPELQGSLSHFAPKPLIDVEIFHWTNEHFDLLVAVEKVTGSIETVESILWGP